jgi:glycosyltransferase involved in cell wall biosynthesis
MPAEDSSLFPDVSSHAQAGRPIRLVFVISGLGLGGAEMMLWKLLSRIDRTRFEPSLISLADSRDAMFPAFRELGIRCETLEWTRGFGIFASMARLCGALRKLRPDVIQGWMYYGNVVATVAAALARVNVPVLWNIRASIMEQKYEKRVTAAMIWLGGKLSFSPIKIINNSWASAAEHEAKLGYRAAKRVVLPNGFDTQIFQPSIQARQALRTALGLERGTLLVGLVARYHPMKDHSTFLHAAAILRRTWPCVHFVLVGDRINSSNAALTALVSALELENHVHLLGPRNDVHLLAAAFDIQVSSSSSGEGFPNVIGEAMSCGVPCVVTDVGDARDVVGETGVTVPPRDPAALAAGLSQLVALSSDDRSELGVRARRRAQERFSLNAVVRLYEELYLQTHQQHNGH